LFCKNEFLKAILHRRETCDEKSILSKTCLSRIYQSDLDRAQFLQFVTGTSKVPLQGFGYLEGMNGYQKFQIHRDDRSTDRLPVAHTW
jgi:hypothetical protein